MYYSVAKHCSYNNKIFKISTPNSLTLLHETKSLYIIILYIKGSLLIINSELSIISSVS